MFHTARTRTVNPALHRCAHSLRMSDCSASRGADQAAPCDEAETRARRLIRRDQLEAVRRSVLIAIPVNALLGLASLLVAANAGLGRAGAIWFAASTVVNLLRVGLCRADCAGLRGVDAAAERSVDRHLSLSSLAALLSGLVWACLPLLCAGYTGPGAVFYLIVTCGITAGAVTHGTSYARIPLCFITPPLLSACGCFASTGDFEQVVLAATVALYLFALGRAAFQSEAGFRATSRLKNDATAIAEAREAARAQASALAETMAERANHDALTGLLNRAGFGQAVDARLRATVTPRPLCLLVLDLDGFKSVNDGYGHAMGDRVLVEIARRLREAVPADGLVARLGGDEFALFYAPTPAEAPPDALAERLIGMVAKPFEVLGAGRLGVGIGAHLASEADLEHRLSCADAALYAAKVMGRNHFRLFDAALGERIAVRRDSERDLSRALAEAALEVWFQPIFAADGRTLAGLEALVRWRHPHHGWIAPPDIVDAANTAGLTESLLRFILDRACAMMGELRARGFGGVRVAMNVSPREMAQIAVDEIVLARLDTLGLPAAMLEIEVTEETALDIATVQDKLRALAAAGVGVAIDDFGSGYSSLALLRQIRASRIKIDRSFVTGLDRQDDRRALVQAVVGLGEALDLEVVAEGVETAEDLATLKALRCPFFQGYHLGRPMPPREAIKVLLVPGTNAA